MTFFIIPLCGHEANAKHSLINNSHQASHSHKAKLFKVIVRTAPMHRCRKLGMIEREQKGSTRPPKRYSDIGLVKTVPCPHPKILVGPASPPPSSHPTPPASYAYAKCPPKSAYFGMVLRAWPYSEKFSCSSYIIKTMHFKCPLYHIANVILWNCYLVLK